MARHSFIALVFLVAAAGCKQQPASMAARDTTSPITVFASASTTDVLREAGRLYETAKGMKVVFSFDSSSNLAKQIKAGAPADIFLSADQKWMDDVAAAGEIQAGTRADLLGNTLVLIAPSGSTFDVTMSSDFDFAASHPAVKRIAVGDPSHVPAGRYAKQALESVEWWTDLEPLLIPAQDVRAALRLVELQEADAGIVYATDARQSDKIAVIAAFPSNTHEAIRYPIALTKDASPAAADFLAFLRSPEVTRVFEHAGFEVIAPSLAAPEDPGD
jgi:molybdate transport system substrate-binding protein